MRATGEDPWQHTVPATDLVAQVRTAVEAEVAQLGRGTLAVIAADGETLAGLADLPVQLHTPVSAKGLEFDVVVIVDPERIRAHNPADLYVSMTRATQLSGCCTSSVEVLGRQESGAVEAGAEQGDVVVEVMTVGHLAHDRVAVGARVVSSYMFGEVGEGVETGVDVLAAFFDEAVGAPQEQRAGWHVEGGLCAGRAGAFPCSHGDAQRHGSAVREVAGRGRG